MRVEKTFIEGPLLIYPDIYEDERGIFFEFYNEKTYQEFGIPNNFVQDNISKSAQNTIRGLHYQVGDFAQGKLCQVIFGKVMDIAVDIRFGSPTFGKHIAIELSDENNIHFWMPQGFAHGFSVLSEHAVFHYKCTALYNKESEKSILFNDDDLKIDWKIDKPIVSAKDKMAAKFSEIEKDFVY